jgi:hypothetical protein
MSNSLRDSQSLKARSWTGRISEIFNTDQGCQLTNLGCTALLQENTVLMSMNDMECFST